MADGPSNREIAEELVVAVGTVKAHSSSIYDKPGVNGRAQAVIRAKGLILDFFCKHGYAKLRIKILILPVYFPICVYKSLWNQ